MMGIPILNFHILDLLSVTLKILSIIDEILSVSEQILSIRSQILSISYKATIFQNLTPSILPINKARLFPAGFHFH